jgi:hypothetical protein
MKFRLIHDALHTGLSEKFYNYFAINTPPDEISTTTKSGAFLTLL